MFDLSLEVIFLTALAFSPSLPKSFVKTEKDRRAGILVDGLKKHSEAETVLGKMKPDHIIFDDDGKPIQQGWSAKQKGERDKAQKLLSKFTVAINAALTGDFKLLEEALKGGGKDTSDAS